MALKFAETLKRVFTSTPLLYLYFFVTLTLLDLAFGTRSGKQLLENLVMAAITTAVVRLFQDHKKYRIASVITVVAALVIWLVLLLMHFM